MKSKFNAMYRSRSIFSLSHCTGYRVDNLRGKICNDYSLFVCFFHSRSISILNVVRLSHAPALTQQLPPISFYILGSLECNNLFLTPPCQISLTHGRICQFCAEQVQRIHQQQIMVVLTVYPNNQNRKQINNTTITTKGSQ